MLIGKGRDLRIDMARGLALMIIFIDHNAFLDPATYGWFTAFTLGRFSFIDAADVFFFISGCASGMVYSHVLIERGFLASVRCALKRCLQLYVAELTLL